MTTKWLKQANERNEMKEREKKKQKNLTKNKTWFYSDINTYIKDRHSSLVAWRSTINLFRFTFHFSIVTNEEEEEWKKK